MSRESGGAAGQAGAPVATAPEAIRNVLVVGAAGAGKTTLVERLLVTAGVLNRAGSTEDGTTVCDFEEVEHRQRRSVGLALAPLVHDGVKVNLLDAPGYVDFVGEVRAGLRAADCALFVVAANEGVDEQTRALWRECADVAMPRVVVVTKVDHARADVDGVVAQARDAFGERVLPVYLQDRGRLVGLITGDHGHDAQRAALVEGIIEESEDETLMERYVGGEEIDAGLLLNDLELAVARGSLHPVVPVDSDQRRGSRRAARPHGVRVPLTARAPDAEGLDAGGSTGPGDRVRPVRSAGRGGRSRRPPTRTSGASAWSACSRGPCCRTPRCTCPGTARCGPWRRPGLQPPGPRRGRADRVPLACRWASPSAPPRPWSPATSAPSDG